MAIALLFGLLAEERRYRVPTMIKKLSQRRQRLVRFGGWGVLCVTLSGCVAMPFKWPAASPEPAALPEQTAAVISRPIPPPVPVAVQTGAGLTTSTYAEVPVAANPPMTEQAKLQAAQHWARIADDAGQSAVAMLKSGKLCKGGIEKCGLIHVKPAAVVSDFSRVFRNQLITRLVKLGAPVTKGNSGVLTVDIDVQPIVFAANRPQYRYAGVPVELGPGIWAIRDVIDGSADNPVHSPAVPDALHWFRSEFAAGQTPRTELFITVSITDARRFLSRSSNAYYITDADKHLYDQDLCSVFQHCPKMAEAAKAAKEAKAAEKKGPPVRSLELVGSPPLPAKAAKSTSKQM